jgi:membrane protein required for colicin V production
MDWLSLVLLVFVGLMAVTGLKRGLVRQILGLLGLVASILLAVKYYEAAAEYVLQYFAVSEGTAIILGFAAVCLGVAAAISILGIIWGRLVRYTPVSILDSLAGALFGLAKGALLAMIMLFIVYALPFEPARQAIDNSSIARELMDLSTVVFRSLEDVFPGELPYLTSPDRANPNGDSVIRFTSNPPGTVRMGDTV